MLPKFEQFIHERQFITNVTPATVRWYRLSLSWLTTEQPTDDDIKKVILSIRSQGRTVTTVNCRLRAIRAYCRWAGLKTVVPKLKEDTRELPTFSEKDVVRLLSWKPKTSSGHRLSTLISLLADVGARIDEALSLQWSDVDFDNLLLLLHGKGGKDRRVPMSLELRKRLFVWKRMQEKSQEKSTRVFGTRDDEKLGHRNVLRDVKNLCRTLGFEPPARTLHAMRHTFATNYLRHGGSVFHLQRALGHSSLEMTRRYAHLQTSDLSAVHERLSLLGQAR